MRVTSATGQDARVVLISAHRCGAGDDPAGENGLHALEHSLRLGVDYVEFDVRRLPDGRLVVSHDVPGEGVELLPYETILRHLAGRAGAHVDLKGSGGEVEAATIALQWVAPDRLLLTTGSVAGARRLRDWADEHAPEVRVGLSTGTSLSGLAPGAALSSLRRQLFPWRRYAEARADVLCAHHVLSALTLRLLARRKGLDLLVWTVDDARLLRWWLRPGRAWMVTTNHPARALAARRAG
jgi:glycerophosphoryl diester phosphodiesterase